jgi:hypothetical protein
MCAKREDLAEHWVQVRRNSLLQALENLRQRSVAVGGQRGPAKRHAVEATP